MSMGPRYCQRCGQPDGSADQHMCGVGLYETPTDLGDTEAAFVSTAAMSDLPDAAIEQRIAEVLAAHRWIDSPYQWTGCSCDRLWWKGWEHIKETEVMYRAHVAAVVAATCAPYNAADAWEAGCEHGIEGHDSEYGECGKSGWDTECNPYRVEARNAE